MGLKIDNTQAGLGFTAEMFVCDELVRTAPLGGVNMASLDSTAVDNMPPCPCSRCGGRNQMVAYWGYPSQTPTLARQGIHAPPPEAFENKYRDGHPIRPRSGTAFVRDGAMYRDPGACELKLFMTTCENADRLGQNEGAAALQQRYGRKGARRDHQKGVVGESNNATGWEGEDQDLSQAWELRKTKDGVTRTKKPIPIDIGP